MFFVLHSNYRVAGLPGFAGRWIRATALPIAVTLMLVVGNRVQAGNPSSQVKTNYYKVTGSTPHEIRHSIDEARPWKMRQNVDAQTHWHIDWKFSSNSSGDLWRLKSFELAVQILIDFPIWDRPPDASDEVIARWKAYIAALWKHENGHRAIAHTAAAEMQRRIARLRPATTQQELRKGVDDICRRVIDEFAQQEVQYEKETHHGAGQGAVFP